MIWKGLSLWPDPLSHSSSTLGNLQDQVSQCSAFANLFHRNFIYKNSSSLLGVLTCHRVVTMRVACWVTLWGTQVLAGTEWNHEVPGEVLIFLFLSRPVPRKMKCVGFTWSCGDVKKLLPESQGMLTRLLLAIRAEATVRIPKQLGKSAHVMNFFADENDRKPLPA